MCQIRVFADAAMVIKLLVILEALPKVFRKYEIPWFGHAISTGQYIFHVQRDHEQYACIHDKNAEYRGNS